VDCSAGVEPSDTRVTA